MAIISQILLSKKKNKLNKESNDTGSLLYNGYGYN